MSVIAEHPVLFIKKLECLTVQEQDTVELEVQLNRMASDIKWMKNGVILQPGNNLNIQVDGAKQTLILKNVSCADQGLYSCETLDDKTEAKLTVESKDFCILYIHLIMPCFLYFCSINLITYASCVYINTLLLVQ